MIDELIDRSKKTVEYLEFAKEKLNSADWDHVSFEVGVSGVSVYLVYKRNENGKATSFRRMEEFSRVNYEGSKDIVLAAYQCGTTIEKMVNIGHVVDQ